MNPRKNIIRMLLAALAMIVICCILLGLSNCSGDAHITGTTCTSQGKP